MQKLFGAAIFLIFQSFQVMAQSQELRGVDFRMQFVSGNLDFTSVSGVRREFDGIGSELQTSLYLLEKNKFRVSMFISSRVMTWVGQDVVAAEYDDIQSFSVAPGLELHFGPLFIQGSSSRMNATAYNISATSKGKQLIIEGPTIAGGFNWKFGNLGLGVGLTQMNFAVPGDSLGLSTPSQYIEKSYSVNLIYYMGIPPGRFFQKLFRK